MDTALKEKLEKILALTTSPVEGEAQAATEMLNKLLAKHNLDIAQLEARGQKAPQIKEQGYDLGKAAFKWKLNLAEVVAGHYFCAPLVNYTSKTVVFVGRPDNVESLQMLYGWLIDQIRRIATEERKAYIANTGEHIDPLRWQLNFGLGAVARLAERLEELRRARQADVNSMALVVHHESEISDYFEEKYGYRRDGRPTKAQQESDDRWNSQQAARRYLKHFNIEAYYRLYPHEHPDAIAKREAELRKDREERAKREERNAKRRKGRAYTYKEYDYEKEEQEYAARSTGKKAADRVAIEPFLNGGESNQQEALSA